MNSLRYGISPMPTSYKIKRKIFSILPKEIKGTIYELGSGWGTLAIPLAQKYETAKIYGIEASPFPYLFSFFRKMVAVSPNLELLKEDFFNRDLKEASLIICYLYPGAMERLSEKFLSELSPGCLVVTHTFRLPNWEPVETFEVEDLYHTKIYLYISHTSKQDF